MKISIIIPVYNSEKYLRECLDSVLAQTYTDFEVLLIDDGSTDTSGAICEEYVAKDARFKVFHKENGGVSSARNLGIEKAKGEWITFVDSDDVLSCDYLKKFTEINYKEKDLIIQKVLLFKGNDFKINQTYPSFDAGCYNVDDFLCLGHKTMIRQPFCKLFKSSTLRREKLKFDENLTLGEDTKFVFEYLQFSDRIQTLDFEGYYYRDTNTGLSKKNLLYEYEENLLNTIAKIIRDLEQKNNLHKGELNHHLIYLTIRTLVSIYTSGLDARDRIKKLKKLIVEQPQVLKIYKNTKGKSKLFYYLLVFRQYYLFDFLYKKVDFRNV